jgi:hypothetical protein
LTGTKFSPVVLNSMMYPNHHNFNYPADRLLSLRGIFKDDELRKPMMYDKDNECCLMGLKRGKTTDLVGHANNIFCYPRSYFGYEEISKECILTGGSGVMDSLDVTYATPTNLTLKIIRGCKKLAKAYPRAGPAS